MDAVSLHLLTLAHHPWKARMHLTSAFNQGTTAAAVIGLATIDYDPNGNLTTGSGGLSSATYTVPVAGVYDVKVSTLLTSGTTSGTYSAGVVLFHNGSNYNNGEFTISLGSSQGNVSSIADNVLCAAGDTLACGLIVNAAPSQFLVGAASLAVHLLSLA